MEQEIHEKHPHTESEIGVLDHNVIPELVSDGADMQAGVRRMEAVSRSWTKTSLIIVYVAYVKQSFFSREFSTDH